MCALVTGKSFRQVRRPNICLGNSQARGKGKQTCGKKNIFLWLSSKKYVFLVKKIHKGGGDVRVEV